MAAGERRHWTVSVRLRSLLPTGRAGAPRARGNAGTAVRRLLAVAGLAAAGWLLGHAGQAHADTVPEPVTAAQSGTVPSSTAEQPVRRATAVTTTVTRAIPASPAHSAGRGTGGGVADKAVTALGDPVVAMPRADITHDLPARPSALLNSPSKLKGGARVSRAQGISWAGRPMGKAAMIRARTAGNFAAPAARSAAPKKKARGERTVFRTVGSSPAPAPGLPRPDRQRVGVVPPLPSGGHMVKAGSLDRPAPLMLAPVVGAVPPAVRTAADEPSFAPD